MTLNFDALTPAPAAATTLGGGAAGVLASRPAMHFAYCTKGRCRTAPKDNRKVYWLRSNLALDSGSETKRMKFLNIKVAHVDGEEGAACSCEGFQPPSVFRKDESRNHSEL
jgi:hypothetical protein